jgi:hypothetical protein
MGIQRRDNHSVSRDMTEEIRVRTMKHKRPTCPASINLPDVNLDISDLNCITPKKKVAMNEEEEILDDDSD